MSLFFRTLRSGSSGNAQLLYSHGCALLIDLGLPVRTALRETLADLRQKGVKPIAALITHEHGDHFAPGPLRAMSGLEIPVYAPQKAINFAVEQLRMGFWSGRPDFRPIDVGESWERPFTLGPFTVRPIEVTHNPDGSCFAYHITVAGRDRELTAVIATDLCHPRSLPAHLVDADLIYLECNHDPHLLKLRPNAGSHFHLENSRCADLLATARAASARPPQHTFLGHLSERRNSPTIALDTIRSVFTSRSVPLDFPLIPAPRHHPSLTVEILSSPH